MAVRKALAANPVLLAEVQSMIAAAAAVARRVEAGRDAYTADAGRDAYVVAGDMTVVNLHSPADDQAREPGLAQRRREILKAGPVVIDDPGALEEWFTWALAPWASVACFGDTFGPGYGYEYAMVNIQLPVASD
jgi:hypothetical protein